MHSSLQERREKAYAAFRLGARHMENKNYQAAIEAYSEANKLDPMNIEITMVLGTAYAQIGSYDRALRCFTTALRVPPKEATVFTNQYPYASLFANIGLLFDLQENWQKAIVAYEKAVSLNHPEGARIRQRLEEIKKMSDEKPTISSYSLSFDLGQDSKKKKR